MILIYLHIKFISYPYSWFWEKFRGKEEGEDGKR
jgi:hypothetical protein